MPDLSSALRDLIDRSIAPVDVDAIVSRRRRRRFRRRAGSTVVVVVIATLVVGGVLARPVHEPKTLTVQPDGEASESDATRAVLDDLTILSTGPPGPDAIGGLGAGPVEVTDPVSGATHEQKFPLDGMDTATAFVHGANIVMVLYSPQDLLETPVGGTYVGGGFGGGQFVGTAYIVSSDLERWRALGPASDAFASLDPNRVWLVTRAPDDAVRVAEVRLDGNAAPAIHALTEGRIPVAAVRGGLLTLRASGPDTSIWEIWDPDAARVVRRLPLPAKASPVAANADYFVWASSERHVLDLRSGVDRVVSLPTGSEWGEVEFSPDGRYLAMVHHTALAEDDAHSRSRVPPGTHTSIILLIDLSSGAETERPVTTWKSSTPLAWSPDSSLLFVARDDEHLYYFNTRFENSPTRELAVPRGDGWTFFVASKTTNSAVGPTP